MLSKLVQWIQPLPLPPPGLYFKTATGASPPLLVKAGELFYVEGFISSLVSKGLSIFNHVIKLGE